VNILFINKYLYIILAAISPLAIIEAEAASERGQRTPNRCQTRITGFKADPEIGRAARTVRFERRVGKMQYERARGDQPRSWERSTI
jgi:hypothetical protein